MKSKLLVVFVVLILMAMSSSGVNAFFHTPDNNGLWIRDASGELKLGCGLIGTECYWGPPKY